MNQKLSLGEAPHRDDLHILDLHFIPLQTPGLQRAKMIKNSRLETCVELFRDSQTGSGQIYIRDLPAAFPGSIKQLQADMPTLEAVASLASFDVYSIRVGFREMGIQVNDIACLELSPHKKMELAVKMVHFTRPLIHQIYGADSRLRISDMDDVLKLFKDPDNDVALQNLKIMSDRLNINIYELPEFLEEYGDIFLSLSYFENELEALIPSLSDFSQRLDIVNENSQLRNDVGVQNILVTVRRNLRLILESLQRRLAAFREKFEAIWGHLDVISFREIKQMIQKNHTTLGGVLCGLAVKMNAWETQFGSNAHISPNKLAEFVRKDIYSGLDHLMQLESQAARISIDHTAVA